MTTAMQKLSGQDALFLHMDRPHAATHVTMIYVYDQSGLAKPLRFRQIIGHLEKRLQDSPFYRRRIVQAPMGLAYPYWADDPDFDIDFHVRHLALPKPGDWRQFQIMVARIHARQLDLTRPPWEMYVIEGLDNADWLPKGSFALVTKAHHAAVDGTALAELTWALHDVEGAKGKPTPVLAKQKNVGRLEAEPTLLDTISRIVLDNVAAPLKLAGPVSRALPKVSVAAMKMLSRVLFSPTGGAPRTRFNQSISSQRVFESVVFDFATIKRIRARGSRRDRQRCGTRDHRRGDAPLSREQEGASRAIAGGAGAGEHAPGRQRTADVRQHDFVPHLSAGERRC